MCSGCRFGLFLRYGYWILTVWYLLGWFFFCVYYNKTLFIFFIANFDIFTFISLSDIVNISELTVILNIFCQCDIIHNMIITLALKVSAYIITTIGLASILMILSVSTFKVAVALYFLLSMEPSLYQQI